MAEPAAEYDIDLLIIGAGPSVSGRGGLEPLHDQRVQGGAEEAQLARIRRFYAGFAPKYDGKIAWIDRRLFADARAWVCSRALAHERRCTTGV